MGQTRVWADFPDLSMMLRSLPPSFEKKTLPPTVFAPNVIAVAVMRNDSGYNRRRLAEDNEKYFTY